MHVGRGLYGAGSGVLRLAAGTVSACRTATTPSSARTPGSGLSRLRTSPVAGIIAGFENTAENPSRPPGICGVDGARCRAQAQLVWQQIIDAAEQAYDRTSAARSRRSSPTNTPPWRPTAAAAATCYPCWDELGTGRAVARLRRLRRPDGSRRSRPAREISSAAPAATTCTATSSSATTTSSTCR